jgi:hypothetical protein
MKNKLLLLCCLLFLINVVQANELLIEPNIYPLGPTSMDYNVVGDIFSYNITLFNNNSELFEDNITLELMIPNNVSYYTIFPVNISSQDSYSLIKYINKSEDKWAIYEFSISGDYKIKICSSQDEVRFKREYVIQKERHKQIRYYDQPKCFTFYFDAMPKWQYDLFITEHSAATETLEATEKLAEYSGDLVNSSDKIEYATWLMLAVALISLLNAIKYGKNSQRILAILIFIAIIFIFIQMYSIIS